MAFRAGRVVARTVDTTASAASRIQDASFADGTGHHRLQLVPAADFNIYIVKPENRELARLKNVLPCISRKKIDHDHYQLNICIDQK